MMVGSKRDETLGKTNLRGGVFFDKQMAGHVGWKTLDMSNRPDISECGSETCTVDSSRYALLIATVKQGGCGGGESPKCRKT